MKFTLRDLFTIQQAFEALAVGRALQGTDGNMVQSPYPFKGKTALTLAKWKKDLGVLSKAHGVFVKDLKARFPDTGEWDTEVKVPAEAKKELDLRLEEEIELSLPKIATSEVESIEGLHVWALSTLQEFGILEEPTGSP